MSNAFSYSLAPPLGHRAQLGLVVLQSDETIEHEFRRLLPSEGVSLYVSRIASEPEVTRETLARMEGEMTGAASLMPQSVEFDAVGYGCTSGTSVIGPDRVAHLIKEGARTRTVTEPVSALVAACQHLGLRRLAFLSPYVAEVSDGLRAVLAQSGVETPVFGSFNEAEETRVARIDGASLVSAAVRLAAQGGVDGVFMSCTNLRTLDVVDRIEAETGLPVLSSNLVLAWHMLRLAGVNDRVVGAGRLFE